MERRCGGGDHATEREIPGGNTFGEGDDVRLQVEPGRGEPVTASSEPGYHFVGYEEGAGARTASRTDGK